MLRRVLWFLYEDVIKWIYFPRCWPFVRGIHRPPVVPLTKTSDTELWYFLCYALEQTAKHTIETLLIWDAIALIMTSPSSWFLPCRFVFFQRWRCMAHAGLKNCDRSYQRAYFYYGHTNSPRCMSTSWHGNVLLITGYFCVGYTPVPVSRVLS